MGREGEFGGYGGGAGEGAFESQKHLGPWQDLDVSWRMKMKRCREGENKSDFVCGGDDGGGDGGDSRLKHQSGWNSGSGKYP